MALFAAGLSFLGGLVVAATPMGAAASTATPNCGGVTVYKAKGVKWTCSFDDEFTGSSLNTKLWSVEQTATSGFTTGPLGSEVCYVNSRNNVSVGHGYLYLTVRKQKTGAHCGLIGSRYTGGTVTSSGKFSQTYGRFEVRAEIPASKIRGLQETFWLWPDNDRKYGAEPRSGEIDFAEMYSLHSGMDIPYLHYVPQNKDATVTSPSCTLSRIGFHTYDLVWTPTTMTISYDGKTCIHTSWTAAHTSSASAPFNQPFFMVLTQALGVGANSFAPTRTPLPATTVVDYVRVWR
jgi:beta-glucanase (GH16 family)